MTFRSIVLVDGSVSSSCPGVVGSLVLSVFARSVERSNKDSRCFPSTLLRSYSYLVRSLSILVHFSWLRKKRCLVYQVQYINWEVTPINWGKWIELT
jgi:hypothetical protein